jgi:hypothetical protein
MPTRAAAWSHEAGQVPGMGHWEDGNPGQGTRSAVAGDGEGLGTGVGLGEGTDEGEAEGVGDGVGEGETGEGDDDGDGEGGVVGSGEGESEGAGAGLGTTGSLHTTSPVRASGSAVTTHSPFGHSGVAGPLIVAGGHMAAGVVRAKINRRILARVVIHALFLRIRRE